MSSIEFYDIKTGAITDKFEYFVLRNNEVWRDNFKTFESQCAVVEFEDFIIKCEGVGWRVIDT
jgi:hypothetical protein